MTPRIPIPILAPTKSASITIPSFLLPSFCCQARYASILANLSDTPGAYNKRKRLGRGPSSGKGKTSGRGQKGQKAHGKVPKGFSGGQTPVEVSHGHYGFKNVSVLPISLFHLPRQIILSLTQYLSHSHGKEMSPINLDRVQSWIDQGRLNSKLPITLKELCASRALHGVKDGVKLLGRGGSSSLTTPINIVVSRASRSAIEAVEAVGGTVTTRFYTKFAIRRIKQGKTDPYVSMKWEPGMLPEPLQLPVGMGADPLQRVKGNGFQYRLPDPVSRKEIEYYRNPEKRGYLSHTLKEGEHPSLFYKPPGDAKVKRERAEVKQQAEGSKLW
ncbi:MAG: hypothetical protein Q9227_002772 [Pyrenula ochraceoflavens]